MLDFLRKRPSLPASLLHRCFYSKVFPRFFLHSASRSSPPPMLSASSVTCSFSRTSSPTTRFASYFHDFSTIALLPLFPTYFRTAASVSSHISSPPLLFASYFSSIALLPLPNLFPIRSVRLFLQLFSTDAFRKLFPRYFLHSPSRFSPSPMLFASYFHDCST